MGAFGVVWGVETAGARAGGDVEGEIELPSNELVDNEVECGFDRGVFEEVVCVVVVGVWEVGFLGGRENGVFLDVPGVAVVAGVGDLPGEIGDE